MMRFYPPKVWFFCMMTLLLLPRASWAAAPSESRPTAEQALTLMPVQSGVDYDRPSPEEAAKCKILAKKIDGHAGWIVESPDGVILRKFVDTNDDNHVDQWSYYKDGLEVYRDIDSNFNGKADQYRWFHTGGSRWGLNPREDGVVESWKSISAEEATAEVIAAIAARDADRFARLVLTPAELKSLGLGKARAEGVAEKIAKATAEFRTMAARQKAVTRNCTWVQFSANRPGVVPAGTDESTKDLRVYENVTALVEDGGKQSQVLIGTLVQVGDAWRVVDLPQPLADGQTETSSTGFFFQASVSHRSETANAAGNDAVQKLLADLEKLDQEAGKATPDGQSRYTDRRADLLEQMAAAAKTAEERSTWLRQAADVISFAVQSGTYPDGANRLRTLFEKVQKDSDKNLAAYVKFRQLTAAYVLSMQASKADYPKIQGEWLKTLEKFISDYPTTPDAAEAMLQLAILQEFNGQEDDSKKWYVRIIKEFPDSPAAKKAAGRRPGWIRWARRSVSAGKAPWAAPWTSPSIAAKSC